MNSVWKSFAVCAVLLGFGLTDHFKSRAVNAQETGGKPNILFLFSDDHARAAMSCYGSKLIQTPNLDRIANEGMRFDRCYVTNSICGPSRAVILTGKHSHLNGFLHNANKFDGSQLTFPKLLQKAGYQTAIIGKWHLSTDPTGFDHWDILIDQGPYFNPPMIRNGERIKRTGYTTEIIGDLALNWLKSERDPKKPFVLMCQHKAPHREWNPGPQQANLFKDVVFPEPATLFDDYTGRGTAAKKQTLSIAKDMNRLDLKFDPPKNLTPEQLVTWHATYDAENKAFEEAKPEGKELVRWKYQRYIRDYLRCVAGVDEQVGRLLAYLDEAGLAKNTVVMYSSDQGFYLGEHGWFDKRFMYEESFSTPFLVKWPGITMPGSVNRDLTSNLDFAQTMLEITGTAANSEMQGRSLVPLLNGNSPSDWRKSLYYHYYEYPQPHSVHPHYGVKTARHKLMHFYDLDEWELYDLETDPQEMTNIYAKPESAAIVQELKTELARLRKEYKVPDAPPHR